MIKTHKQISDNRLAVRCHLAFNELPGYMHRDLHALQI